MTGPGEFELIRDFFAGAKKIDQSVRLGIGDDCALLQPPADGLLATSVDTLVAGVHFPAAAAPALIAARALRVNLSDLAAMNAEPLWFTLALTLPHNNEAWLREFSRGLLETAEIFRISLVGGDTTCGPLSITVQVTGSCKLPLYRRGATAGDDIYVSAPLGAAAAALPVVLGQRTVQEIERQAAQQAYYFPEPQLATAAAIGKLATSAIDVSDGLLADLGHICEASGVGADVDMRALPVAPLARQLAGDRALQLAASGGDDYALCFTLPRQHRATLGKRGLNAARIGTIIEGSGEVRCWLGGERWFPETTGYQHF